jgi:hypothetical protein
VPDVVGIAAAALLGDWKLKIMYDINNKIYTIIQIDKEERSLIVSCCKSVKMEISLLNIF